ncbi:protein mono-ADP-ribosyltransferase PARP14-like [Neoarius graeffei]|uniref:protein mono-ADP-ribosyltransferase PARP14-like n=1 Tax=Neoarius graeffei TaxID=443677 RepID=UPI00298C34E5|nr:protein mono-ADP-ribosyltransferase PARP14-like [Neoarius graeffei]
MSDYQYPVLFEANNLSDGEVKKIRNYFKIRRQSGGGECGEVEKVGENTYKISFLEKTAQDRVLSKTDHIISLPGCGNVHILIKSCDTKEEKQLLPHSTSEQQATRDSPLQKVFKLDPYLLRYLKGNSRAKSDLEDQLSSLLSSFKLDMVTETVVVVRDAVQTASNDDVQQKWETKVDIVFSDLQDHYIIHFEVAPNRLEILQKNPFLFPQHLGIFEEDGLFVIVGENKEVQKFLQVIDAFHLRQQARQECPVSEIHYALVKDQFALEIKSKFSNLELTQAQPGCLVLKGPEEQVNSAATKLQELLNQIQEKRMPLPHPLGTFLLSSGAIQIFQTRFQQNLCSPVLLEPTGSNLVLLSLSPGALQEAATAMQRDLCVETVLLEQAESESPGIDTLKNTLSPALQQANHGAPKVEISYEPVSGSDPRMKVLLVGYKPEVNKLKNIIQDYKQNYAEYSDTVPLPFPEMVDNFSKLLSLLGVTATNVNLTATSSPVPCVHLSGPRCKVTDMKNKLHSSFSHLKHKKISVDGPGVLQFFQDEGLNTQALLQSSCQVLISLINDVQTGAPAARNTSFTSLPPIPASVSHPGYSVALEIVFGCLEDQQADVFVVPMLNANLSSTKVGKSLLNKAGQQFKNNFDAAKGRCRITPGDVLEVDGTPLGCKKVFFIECVPWTGNAHSSEKELRCGLERALAFSEQQAWSSVTLPLIGPGIALAVPVQNATNILTGEIGTFVLTRSTGSLRTIRIVIMPNCTDSEEIYHAVSTGLTDIMVDHTGQAVFQSLSSEIDEISIPVGRCQLHLIFGDISNETTDVIVNTTDFTDLQTDVCNDILTIAGPQVRDALAGAQVKKGEIFITQPGEFPCKAIMHVCGEKDTAIIKKLVQDILLKSENNGYKSVAIPAICAGKGGLDAHLVAQAILQGVKDATRQANLNNIKRINIVLMKIHIFLAFKAMAQQLFGRFTQTAAPLQSTPLRAAPSSLPLDLSSLVQSLPDQHITAKFLVVGLTDDNVSRACRELHQAYKSHCSSHFVSQEELKHLLPTEMDDIINNVTSLGIQISQRGPGGLQVSGLARGVNEFMRLIQGALVRQVRERDMDRVFSDISWCILGSRGVWERLPKEANHQLESRNVGGGILDAQAQKWTVNLTKMEATAVGSRTRAKIKRLENLPDFFFPLYWDTMTTVEVLKVVPLQSSSAEYKKVKSDFKRTVAKAVIKIERIQNVNLRRAYEVRKRELQEKNGTVGAGERFLYHGTTADACTSIQRSNFNRRFAGQNGTMYGLGTYFAVDANYSANPRYSVPSADGTQLMFVTLVLTGYYTQGQSDMNVPPPRSPQDPNDRFDSVVDNLQKPSMFVVFHDCQAYPDYLITFK